MSLNLYRFVVAFNLPPDQIDVGAATAHDAKITACDMMRRALLKAARDVHAAGCVKMERITRGAPDLPGCCEGQSLDGGGQTPTEDAL